MEVSLPEYKSLTFRCPKCTRQVEIPGQTNDEVYGAAYLIGWRPDGDRTVCPKCPGGNRRGNLTMERAVHLTKALLAQKAEEEARAAEVAV